MQDHIYTKILKQKADENMDAACINFSAVAKNRDIYNLRFMDLINYKDFVAYLNNEVAASANEIIERKFIKVNEKKLNSSLNVEKLYILAL